MRILFLITCAILLNSCAVCEVGTLHNNRVYFDRAGVSPKKVIFITIDGTSNTLTSRTNAGRLFEMVDSYTPLRQDKQIATWYAEGVGSGDAKLFGLSMGAGMGQDVKNAYSFLTRVWQPGDEIYLSGFSRGSYAVRVLGGFLYSAGIPDLSALPKKERSQIVDALFDAYKTGSKGHESFESHAKRRDSRIRRVQDKYHLTKELSSHPERDSGYRNAHSLVTIEALMIWDTVAALGFPDGSENPLEGPDHYLLTSCNVRRIFHALSLDDNRVYSFTPILADGPKMFEPCKGLRDRQNKHEKTQEVWFSGAHADVGGTYEHDGLLDGSLPAVSLNWMLSEIQKNNFGLLPFGLGAAEDRLSSVHDPERDGPQNKILYRQSRKPSAFTSYAYRKDMPLVASNPIKIHASVLDRLEWIFAIDKLDSRCSGKGRIEGKPLLCAEELSSYSLVPEMYKLRCIKPSDWGYVMVLDGTQDESCPELVGNRTFPKPKISLDHGCPASDQKFVGSVYQGSLSQVDLRTLDLEGIEIPYPNCWRSGNEAAP